jgi:hypothetical protein
MVDINDVPILNASSWGEFGANVSRIVEGIRRKGKGKKTWQEYKRTYTNDARKM